MVILLAWKTLVDAHGRTVCRRETSHCIAASLVSSSLVHCTSERGGESARLPLAVVDGRGLEDKSL